MHFRFDIKASDKDYYDYNMFIMTRSLHGKKQLKNLRIFPAILIAAMILLKIIGSGLGVDSLVYSVIYLALLAVIELLLVPYFRMCVRAKIRQMRKTGKLLYTPSSIIEFSEDHFVETSPEITTEVKYSAIQYVSVIQGKVIYLHQSETFGYIIPCTAFDSDKTWLNFVDFLKSKFNNVNFYN